LSYFAYSSPQGDPAWKKKISNRLQEKLKTNKNVDFIIYLKHQFIARIYDKNMSKQAKAKEVFLKLKHSNLNSQKNLIDFLDQKGVSYRRFFIVNAIAVKGDAALIEQLAAREDVAYIAADTWTKQNGYFSRPEVVKRDPPENTSATTWGIKMINAGSVWQMGFKGAGVVVGGQDTGYDWRHEALVTKYRGFIDENAADHNYNWHDAIHEINPLNNDSIISPFNNPCGLDSPQPCDDNGHGTHTMGTMIGSKDSLIIGVAPSSKWIGCRNMERGWGKPSTYIECFEWFLAPTDLEGKNPDPAKAPDVINNSWSCPEIEGCDSTNWKYMEIALNNLRASGVFIVVAAGNSGIWHCGTVNAPPAIFENSFTTGATSPAFDSTKMSYFDIIAQFSSIGPVSVDHSNRLKPDITAPGTMVYSSYPGNIYVYSNGTSMAAPHVAGVVALMLSANPGLKGKPGAIAQILINTADPKPHIDTCRGNNSVTVPNAVYGYGRVNALKAVQEALRMKKPANFSAKDVVLYPNPVENYLYIKFDNVYKDFTVAIFDIQGRLLTRHIKGQQKKLNVSGLNRGMYILMLQQENAVVFKKFIKI